MALIFMNQILGRACLCRPVCGELSTGRGGSNREGGMQQWWRPERFAERRARLAARAAMREAVRRFFAAADFVEVETPVLQASPGLEPHLKAFRTDLHEPGAVVLPRYLHTSPEFAMKKLLVAGLPRIWQL